MEPTDMWRYQIPATLLRICLVIAITYYSTKWMINQMDPMSKYKKKVKQLAEQQLKKINDLTSEHQIKKFTIQSFTEHELMIASLLASPGDIDISWSDIAGLDEVIQELRESIVLPVQHAAMFKHSRLWSPPKGVLLYGPPGCGKTLIAKAIAKEAAMRFINVDVSMLTDKWYGESQKLATALFTMAQKLEPCIIFIDEIDSFLRNRAPGDHEATAMMKTQFMLQWDGLTTNTNKVVIVLGATNRPQDLDRAILRRLSTRFHIGHPQEQQRHDILRIILKNEQLHDTVDLFELARQSHGFSGSDLHEMCRSASTYRMRQLLRKTQHNDEANILEEIEPCSHNLAITMEHLMKSLTNMKQSKFQLATSSIRKYLDLD